MADLPLPRAGRSAVLGRLIRRGAHPEDTGSRRGRSYYGGVVPEDRLLTLELPRFIATALRTMIDQGHEVALVGGAVRSALRGKAHHGEWDVATSARPDAVAALFPGAKWENRFGTVTLLGDPRVEITSYRTEGTYADRRRPDEVRFGASLTEDLARRDFTVNAVAWVPDAVEHGRGHLVDPHGGIGDLRAGVLRTVGDPVERFREDALRLLRAPRFAATIGLRIEPRTEAAIRQLAPTAAEVSGERVRDELRRMLVAARPSTALRLLEELALLAIVLPEVAALRGVAQAKRAPGDALDHSLATVDAVPPRPEDETRTFVERLAALLHDVGKASTAADGHFIGHERVGAEVAGRVLDRLRIGTADRVRIVGAIRHHMYGYDASWSDAAVRRFVRRTAGIDRELLWTLRRADDAASGAPADHVARQTERALGIPPGPDVGRLLDRLRDAVIADPERNERAALLALAATVHPLRPGTIPADDQEASG
jgi:tRNA nucleotidyltransferase (CCA-adding enzyme)